MSEGGASPQMGKTGLEPASSELFTKRSTKLSYFPENSSPFIQGRLNLYRILRTDLVTEVLLRHSPNDPNYEELMALRTLAILFQALHAVVALITY